MSSLTPCLWHKSEAEEAARFYVGIFPRSSIDATYLSAGDSPGGKAGDLMLVEFTLGGQKLQALNGGIAFEYNHAISLVFECEDQRELDRIWDALLEGGEAEQCGWIKDRYGVRWQIVPKGMAKYLGGDPEAAKRAFAAVMEMIKIDIAVLDQAWKGE